MDISVVTGTYNRLHSLKRMVYSVRGSIGIGLEYEIVLVDGGSTDDTIEWCKEQKDVVLIEQGELLGGIKAFNAGCFAATGDYVIVGNDDIEFIDFSILHAYSYMQDHPTCGIGCFQQDRDNKEMHVARMPALLMQNNKLEKISVYYGQVCIVQRWLGDKVGWWGTMGAYTYAGDNELSCNVWEAGYKVSPLPCACIHDFVVEDELRRHNHSNPERVHQEGKMHPDTAAWVKKWKKEEGIGPILPDAFKTSSPIEKHRRILYAPIFEREHAALQRKTKVTLRNELKKVGKVYECDYMTDGMDGLLDSAYTFAPDLFVMQVHSSRHVDLQTMHELKDNHPNAKFFNWNGDYHPNVLSSPDYMNILKLFDVASHVNTYFDALYEENGINTAFIQAGYEEWCDDEYAPLEEELVDFIFLGNGYSDSRLNLANTIMSDDIDATVRLVGGWPVKYNSISTLYDYARNYELYKSAKFIISDQQWPHADGYVSDRLMHSMRSGTCVLQQWFKGMDSMMGLKHGENLLVWKNLNDLSILMKTCMTMPDKDRIRIGEAGRLHIMKHYSYAKFVERMLKKLQ